jgi:hypothetical protein
MIIFADGILLMCLSEKCSNYFFSIYGQLCFILLVETGFLKMI